MSIGPKCPRCASSRVTVANASNGLDYLRMLAGDFPARCADCTTRFRIHGGVLKAVLYAQCPQCLRHDLSTWDPRYYRAPAWDRFQAAIGARRLRCESCRNNFVSFLPRQAKYERPVLRQTEQVR